MAYLTEQLVLSITTATVPSFPSHSRSSCLPSRFVPVGEIQIQLFLPFFFLPSLLPILACRFPVPEGGWFPFSLASSVGHYIIALVRSDAVWVLALLVKRSCAACGGLKGLAWCLGLNTASKSWEASSLFKVETSAAAQTGSRNRPLTTNLLLYRPVRLENPLVLALRQHQLGKIRGLGLPSQLPVLIRSPTGEDHTHLRLYPCELIRHG